MDSLYVTQKRVRQYFRSDLPTAKIARLRATGAVTAASTMVTVRLGDVERVVKLYLRRFPNGGSWSLFIAPCCGRRAQTLRLMFGELYCGRCLDERGVVSRYGPLSVKKRALLQALELTARLGSDKSERLKPHLWGTMERRKRFEARLARAEFILSQGRKFRDVVVEEIPPEPIAEPKIKTPRKR